MKKSANKMYNTGNVDTGKVSELMWRRQELSQTIRDAQYEKMNLEDDITREIFENGNHRYLKVDWNLIRKEIM